MKLKGMKKAAAVIFFALTLMPLSAWSEIPWVTEAHAQITAQSSGDTFTITTDCEPGEPGEGPGMTITLVIKDDPDKDDFDVTLPASLTYDGKAKKATARAKSGITGMGEITVEYYKGATKVDQAIDVGDYTFKLKVDEGYLYRAAPSITSPDWKFTIVKAKPTVTAPAAKKGLKASGSAQALVNAGKATGGTMYYAKGNDGKTAPSSGWSTAIPKGAEAETYYVWYKVTGDKNHTDINPACVPVTIAKKDEPKQDPPKENPPAPEKNPPAPTPEKKEAPKQTKKTDVSILLNANIRLSWKDSKAVFKWGNAPGADTYEVWMAYCGKPLKKVLTVHNVNKVEIEEIHGKKLNKKRSVKAYVVAYQKGTVIGKSLDCHSAGVKSRFTNAKKVKTSKNTYKLKVGETKKLKAKAVKKNSSKVFLGKHHCARLRYASSDPSIATVSKKGTITAKKAGTCKVWAYAQNGRSKKVTVVVE